MNELKKHKRIRLLDIADVERSKKGIIYPAGTIAIQVSATKGDTIFLEESSEIEPSKYAIIKPKKEVKDYYLYSAIIREISKFLSRYIQNINISIDDFKHFEIDYHENLETQQEIVNTMRTLDDAIKLQEGIIEKNKIIKKNLLNDMFV